MFEIPVCEVLLQQSLGIGPNVVQCRFSQNISTFFIVQNGDSKPNKDFKKTKTIEDVAKVFTEYIENDAQLRVSIIDSLIIHQLID